MNNKKNIIKSKSLSKMAWQRLKRNKLSVFGMFIIFVAVMIAILGPLARPDNTPKANDQTLELTTKKPGFSIDLLRIKKNRKAINQSWWSKFSEGIENVYQVIPVYDYSFEGAKIVVEKYTGGDVNNGPIVKFDLADVVFSLENSQINEINGSLEFYTHEEGKKTMTIEELQNEIKSKNIIRKTYYLGTDKYGRDLLSRLMAGTWISLSVGFISVFISLVIGITFGAIGGYFRGWVDDVIIWIINVVWSIPTLLLVIAITLALGKGHWQVFIAVGLTMWVEVARVVRGQVLSLREKEFVEAGRALGFTNFRIISGHIIPNVLGPVIVISAINFAAAILVEAGLSFIGIGAQPPQATWGKIIAEHKGYIITGNAYLAAFPGIAIVLMVLAFILVGNGLRDALDSKTVDDLPVV
ncbi:MAG: ABC transporter permease [Vicingaceae bacterium]|nr:ABC transporter permease [Flavobacteriales bacterium]MBQ21226.1 peptide transporter [Flavobacteriales bacterium]MDF1676769.1 ABC transporter permease [Vicingaceae bacterium]|tara:strand:- start:7059 stop:8294 length:1236 start_codon:yes stop_codon:yes gene_type:complete